MCSSKKFSNKRVNFSQVTPYPSPIIGERSEPLSGHVNGSSRYIFIGERAKPHTNWSKWKIAIFICYTYVTQNAHALTDVHEIATKQRHNKQSFSLSLKLKYYCSEYYGTQRTRKQAKEGPRTPSRN